jgi:hypothetical protein
LPVIQPISYAVQDQMSNFEQAVFNHYSTSTELRVSYQKINHIISSLPKLLLDNGFDALSIQNFIDTKPSRSNLHPLQSYFHDTMHQTFNLEPYIAQLLAQHILNYSISDEFLTRISKLYQFPFNPFDSQ